MREKFVWTQFVVRRSGEEVFWRGICRLHAHHARVLVGLNVDIVFLSGFHFLMGTNTCWLLKKYIIHSHPAIYIFWVILPTWAHVSLQFCLSWLLACRVTLSRFYCRITNAKLRVQQRVIQDGIKSKVTYEGTALDPTNKPGAEIPSRPSWPPGLKCLPLLVRAERRREDTVSPTKTQHPFLFSLLLTDGLCLHKWWKELNYFLYCFLFLFVFWRLKRQQLQTSRSQNVETKRVTSMNFNFVMLFHPDINKTDLPDTFSHRWTQKRMTCSYGPHRNQTGNTVVMWYT